MCNSKFLDTTLKFTIVCNRSITGKDCKTVDIGLASVNQYTKCNLELSSNPHNITQ